MVCSIDYMVSYNYLERYNFKLPISHYWTADSKFSSGWGVLAKEYILRTVILEGHIESGADLVE